MTLKLAATIHLGCSQTTTGKNQKVNLRVRDQSSGIQWFEVEIDPTEFTQALLFHKGEISGVVEVQDQLVSKLGYKRESMDQSVILSAEEPGLDWSKQYKKSKEFYAELAEVCQGLLEEHYPGWTVGGYFGSQGDIKDNRDGTKTVKCRLYRFTEERNVI